MGESVEISEATTVSRADFDKLKKGDMITITYGSSISSGQTRTFQVKSKTRSAKYNVDKVNMVDPKRRWYEVPSLQSRWQRCNPRIG